mgnify:CR=1 FL=1
MQARRNHRKRFNLVAVLWVDAKIHSDEETPLPYPVPALTCGLLIENNPQRVTVAFEMFGDGDMRQKQSIPRKMVLRVIPLKQLPLPKEFTDFHLRDILARSQGRPHWPGYEHIVV